MTVREVLYIYSYAIKRKQQLAKAATIFGHIYLRKRTLKLNIHHRQKSKSTWHFQERERILDNSERQGYLSVYRNSPSNDRKYTRSEIEATD